MVEDLFLPVAIEVVCREGGFGVAARFVKHFSAVKLDDEVRLTNVFEIDDKLSVSEPLPEIDRLPYCGDIAAVKVVFDQVRDGSRAVEYRVVAGSGSGLC